MLSEAWALLKTRLGDQQSSILWLQHTHKHQALTKSISVIHHDPNTSK